MNRLEFASSVITGLAWPIAVIVVAVLLRKEISKLFQRMKAVGPSGAEFYEQAKSSISIEGARSEPYFDRKLPEFGGKTLDDIRGDVSYQLEKMPEGERQTWLVNAVSVERYERQLALVYASIFGTQIDALEHLNDRPIPVAEFEGMFDALQKVRPEYQRANLGMFLDFLNRNDLVVLQGNTLEISSKGKDFLVFMSKFGLPKDKKS